MYSSIKFSTFDLLYDHWLRVAIDHKVSQMLMYFLCVANISRYNLHNSECKETVNSVTTTPKISNVCRSRVASYHTFVTARHNCLRFHIHFQAMYKELYNVFWVDYVICIYDASQLSIYLSEDFLRQFIASYRSIKMWF